MICLVPVLEIVTRFRKGVVAVREAVDHQRCAVRGPLYAIVQRGKSCGLVGCQCCDPSPLFCSECIVQQSDLRTRDFLIAGDVCLADEYCTAARVLVVAIMPLSPIPEVAGSMHPSLTIARFFICLRFRITNQENTAGCIKRNLFRLIDIPYDLLVHVIIGYRIVAIIRGD